MGLCWADVAKLCIKSPAWVSLSYCGLKVRFPAPLVCARPPLQPRTDRRAHDVPLLPSFVEHLHGTTEAHTCLIRRANTTSYRVFRNRSHYRLLLLNGVMFPRNRPTKGICRRGFKLPRTSEIRERTSCRMRVLLPARNVKTVEQFLMLNGGKW